MNKKIRDYIIESMDFSENEIGIYDNSPLKEKLKYIVAEVQRVKYFFYQDRNLKVPYEEEFTNFTLGLPSFLNIDFTDEERLLRVEEWEGKKIDRNNEHATVFYTKLFHRKIYFTFLDMLHENNLHITNGVQYRKEIEANYNNN